MASAPDVAPEHEPGTVLERLIGQLTARLMAQEPFRALIQLEAREAEGRPLQGLGPSDVARHLESELSGFKEYRALRLLRQARTELRETPDNPAAPTVIDAPTFVSSGPQTAATQAAQTETALQPAVASVAGKETAGLNHAAASAAVALMFAPKPAPLRLAAEPAALSTEPPNALVPATAPKAVNPSVAALASPPPAANPTSPAFQRVDAAGADVLASVARLRRPDAPPPASLATTPVTPEVAPPADLAASMPPSLEPAGPRSQPVSLEGTMASMAKAVAVTVAAAERLSSPPAGAAIEVASAPAPKGENGLFARPGIQSNRPAEATSGPGEAAEICFVARPADPKIDALPGAPPTRPQAAIPVNATPQQLIPAARSYEEASVEIRRPGRLGAAQGSDRPQGLDVEASLGERASNVLNRFVKALRRDKE